MMWIQFEDLLHIIQPETGSKGYMCLKSFILLFHDDNSSNTDFQQICQGNLHVYLWICTDLRYYIKVSPCKTLADLVGVLKLADYMPRLIDARLIIVQLRWSRKHQGVGCVTTYSW